MKIGLLSDAHGNKYGLELCLKFFEKEKIKKIFYLGDTLDYFPDHNQVCSILKKKVFGCLLGNHDVNRLDNFNANNKAYLSQLLPIKEVQLLGRKLLFVHGSPWDPLNEYIFSDSDLSEFQKLSCDAVFMGHTHRPFSQKIAGKLIVNVGSCGQPRDFGIMSSCAIYDLEKNDVNIYRIPMKIDKILTMYAKETNDSIKKTLERTTENLIGKVVNI